ncbi:hypothetical protein AB0H34_46770 [Saccharopolyspora shandongensis]|uniref:hypothetical protein n=1 Tax=Saccharopolyspora shandongensis TaxID=418495 RepID=UPI0033C01015
MPPEQDAILRRIDNELMGPWKDGKPSGWPTAIGPRTVVAMLVDLHNALLAPQNSRYPGSKVKVSAVDAIRDNNGLLFQLPAMVNAAGQADPGAVAAALRPALAEVVGPVVAESVHAALGAGNQDQANVSPKQISPAPNLLRLGRIPSDANPTQVGPMRTVRSNPQLSNLRRRLSKAHLVALRPPRLVSALRHLFRRMSCGNMAQLHQMRARAHSK